MIEWSQVKEKAPDKIGPGIYLGMPYEAYAAIPAIRSSELIHFRKTAAHAHWAMTHPRTSPDMELGQALHLALLEPDRFDAEVAVRPVEITDLRVKVQKLAYQRFLASNAGKIILLPQQMESIRGLQQSVLAHPSASGLLYGEGRNEVSFVWHGPADGEREQGPLHKGRSDRLALFNGWSIVVDVKSSRDASRHAFERSAHQYGYWEQAALYLDGLEALAPIPEGGEFRRFVWIVCEDEPPYCVAVYEADPECLAWGRDRYQKYERMLVEAVRSGVWAGYGEGWDTLGLPGWVLKTFAEEA